MKIEFENVKQMFIFYLISVRALNGPLLLTNLCTLHLISTKKDTVAKTEDCNPDDSIRTPTIALTMGAKESQEWCLVVGATAWWCDHFNGAANQPTNPPQHPASLPRLPTPTGPLMIIISQLRLKSRSPEIQRQFAELCVAAKSSKL